jgi:rod shape-determining protein MreD
MMLVQSQESRTWFIITTSILISLILALLPMPHWIAIFKPAWVLMVMAFWALVLPGRFSITLAWVLGLFLDVLNGTLLGEHALALTAVIYIVARLNNQLRMFSLAQQGVGMFLLVLFYQFILFCVQGFLGKIITEAWWYWLPALTSMLLWPWVFIIMRDWYHRFEG